MTLLMIWWGTTLVHEIMHTAKILSHMCYRLNTGVLGYHFVWNLSCEGLCAVCKHPARLFHFESLCYTIWSTEREKKNKTYSLMISYMLCLLPWGMHAYFWPTNDCMFDIQVCHSSQTIVRNITMAECKQYLWY